MINENNILSDDELENVSGGKNTTGREMDLVMHGTRPKSKSAVQTGKKPKAVNLFSNKKSSTQPVEGKAVLGDFLGPGTMC